MGSTLNAKFDGNAALEDQAEWLPLVVFPRAHVSERGWYEDARACIQRYLPRLGCILFRGFAVDERCLIDVLSAQLLERTMIAPWGNTGDLVLVHCHAHAEPTDLIDLRELYRAVPAPTRARLVDRGLRYVQVLTRDRWPEVFASSDPLVVATWCANNDTSYEWLDDGQLRLARSAQAVMRCAGELTWSPRTSRFLDAHASRSLQYADGQPIERSLLADLAQAIASAETRIAWEPGDLLVVDRTRFDARPLSFEEIPGLSCTRIALAARSTGQIASIARR